MHKCLKQTLQQKYPEKHNKWSEKKGNSWRQFKPWFSLSYCLHV